MLLSTSVGEAFEERQVANIRRVVAKYTVPPNTRLRATAQGAAPEPERSAHLGGRAPAAEAEHVCFGGRYTRRRDPGSTARWDKDSDG